MKKTTYAAASLAAAISTAFLAGAGQRASKGPDASMRDRNADIRAFNLDGTRMSSPAEGGIAGTPLLQTCFEAPFVLGPIDGQNGWTCFTANQFNPVISNVAPPEGAQLLEIQTGPGATGSLNGAFTPLLVAPPDVYTVTVRFMNTAADPNGRDGHIAPQAPSQTFVWTRVIIQFDGSILVLDGDPAAFVDTGTDWVPGQWHELKIVGDNVTDSGQFFLDGTLFYTSTNMFATAVEQVVLFSDNFPASTMNYDCLTVEQGGGPACAEDIDGDGSVEVDDLVAVILDWGCAGACVADVNGDNVVNVDDLVAIILGWGPC